MVLCDTSIVRLAACVECLEVDVTLSAWTNWHQEAAESYIAATMRYVTLCCSMVKVYVALRLSMSVYVVLSESTLVYATLYETPHSNMTLYTAISWYTLVYISLY